MKKILFIIFLSFLIAFGIFLVLIQTFYQEQEIALIENEKNYYSSIQGIDNKIFLVGGSHISAINPFFIEEFLAENNEEYEVFNLSKMANRPLREIKNIDLLISAKPEIIVYGISARDFAEIQSINKPTVKSNQPLPDPSLFFKNWLNIQNSELLILQPDFSPKLITLKEIRGISVNSQDYIKAPFFRFDYKRDFNVMDDKELKLQAIGDAKLVEITSINKNQDLSSLKKIITKLEENNIKIILFTTPQHKYFYDLVDITEKKAFEEIIIDLEKSHNLEINQFTEKYSDLEIWRNPTHIVVSKSASIFSDDIANLILEELR
jgi:predicted lactoylglutathione lyase